MLRLNKYLKYLWWNIYYLFVPTKDALSFVRKFERTDWPWRKFKPTIWKHKKLGFWQIYFEDAPDYTVTRKTITVDLHLALDDNRVVGLNIYTKDLQKPPTSGG